MLNKNESFLRRDQAVSWLWACRKAGFNRDVSRLIASHVFDGFKYVHGASDMLFGGTRYTLQFENGRLIANGKLPGTCGEMNPNQHAKLCYVILREMLENSLT